MCLPSPKAHSKRPAPKSFDNFVNLTVVWSKLWCLEYSFKILQIGEGEEFIQSYQVSSKKDNTFMQYMFGMMIENNPKGVSSSDLTSVSASGTFDSILKE